MVLGLTLLLVLGQVVHLAHRVVAGVALGVVLGLIAGGTRQSQKELKVKRVFPQRKRKEIRINYEPHFVPSSPNNIFPACKIE